MKLMRPAIAERLDTPELDRLTRQPALIFQRRSPTPHFGGPRTHGGYDPQIRTRLRCCTMNLPQGSICPKSSGGPSHPLPSLFPPLPSFSLFRLQTKIFSCQCGVIFNQWGDKPLQRPPTNRTLPTPSFIILCLLVRKLNHVDKQTNKQTNRQTDAAGTIRRFSLRYDVGITNTKHLLCDE